MTRSKLQITSSIFSIPFMIAQKICTKLLAILLLFLLFSCDTAETEVDPNIGIFPPENITEALNYALTLSNPDASGDFALLIWQNGELLVEEYRGELNGSTPHPVYSGTKSLAGIMAALAVRDGLFSFDSTLGELIESWDPESERGKVTIRQLLNLTSGIETAPIGSVLNQNRSVWINSDMAFDRGSAFVYGPTPFYILTMIFVDTFSISPINYLNEELFTPLGLTHPVWGFTLFEENLPNLSFGVSYPALQWLQIGLLLANNGTLDGVEILPESIFNELIKPTNAAPAYGITFWLNKEVDPNSAFAAGIPGGTGINLQSRLISDRLPSDAFMKSGAFGQKLYVIPSLDLVIVRYGPTLVTGYSDYEFFERLMQNI